MKANSFVSVRHTHEHSLFFFDRAIYSQCDRQSACGHVAPSHGEHVNRATYDELLSQQPWTLVYDTVIWVYDITCREKWRSLAGLENCLQMLGRARAAQPRLARILSVALSAH